MRLTNPRSPGLVSLYFALACFPSSAPPEDDNAATESEASGSSTDVEHEQDDASESSGEGVVSSAGSTTGGAMNDASTTGAMSTSSGDGTTTWSSSSGTTSSTPPTTSTATTGGTDSAGEASTDDSSGTATTRVYLLFGQSNMFGVPAPEAQDMVTDPRIEVLTLESCGSHGMNEWVVAQPPLHGCVGSPPGGAYGPGLGPGDYFSRVVAEAYPNDTILLVPHAVSGVSINCFGPSGSGMVDSGQYCTAEGPAGSVYDAFLARARMAQERGEIHGILFHQGESDCGSSDWPMRVKTIVDRLKSDLGIGDVPFLAGQIPSQNSCSQSHNPRVDELPGIIANAHVVPAADLPIFDQYHFDVASQRTLGTRYGKRMLEVD